MGISPFKELAVLTVENYDKEEAKKNMQVPFNCSVADVKEILSSVYKMRN